VTPWFNLWRYQVCCFACSALDWNDRLGLSFQHHIQVFSFVQQVDKSLMSERDKSGYHSGSLAAYVVVFSNFLLNFGDFSRKKLLQFLVILIIRI
jgi:cytosine/uracil/thiamine/allantoin permease